ncbi:MAG: hypothetical protein ACREJC_11260, partial [Tepidisphaeraceae bacterium]
QLPRSDGVPAALAPIGGVVELPAGTFVTSRGIKLPSGVTLKGQGAATIIKCSAPADSAAILLSSPYGHGSNIAAHVVGLCIYTDKARGVAVDSEVSRTVEDLVLRDLILNTAGTALDLMPPGSREPLYFPEIRNIRCRTLGSGAIRIYARVAAISGFKMSNFPREGFVAPKDAMCVFDGHGTISDSQFEGYPNASMMLMKGTWTLRGNWCESYAENVPHVTCDHAIIDADNLFFFHPKAKLILRSSWVTTSHLENRNDPSAVEADEKSKLTVANEPGKSRNVGK